MCDYPRTIGSCQNSSTLTWPLLPAFGTKSLMNKNKESVHCMRINCIQSASRADCERFIKNRLPGPQSPCLSVRPSHLRKQHDPKTTFNSRPKMHSTEKNDKGGNDKTLDIPCIQPQNGVPLLPNQPIGRLSKPSQYREEGCHKSDVSLELRRRSTLQLPYMIGPVSSNLQAHDFQI